jgi:epoxyqueuosine reductase
LRAGEFNVGCEIDTGIFIPERRAASRAGVTTFGKNNFAYARGTGSLILLSSIVADKELEYDAPMNDIN